MNKRHEGKTVVITGAGRGIGKHLALKFAEEGANVVVSSNEAIVSEVADEINANGGKSISVIADVTKKSDVINLYQTAEDTYKRIDISVQNAGVIKIAKLEDTTEEDFDFVMEVNTKGVFLCAQEAALRMRKYGNGGRIINAASGQARQGFIYTPAYAASKFAVIGMTQSLAKELAKEKITVNAYCPGIIKSDMWDYNDKVWGNLLGDYKPGELMQEWVDGIPMGVAGDGTEVADLVSFLASKEASYLTGQTINIDGGLIMS